VKKIGRGDIIGQQGMNLIEKRTLEMGFVWHPTHLDAGIDGYIEIRDSVTGEVSNCIIQVQSKATAQPFEAEKGILCPSASREGERFSVGSQGQRPPRSSHCFQSFGRSEAISRQKLLSVLVTRGNARRCHRLTGCNLHRDGLVEG
jgi:hypothetical protein